METCSLAYPKNTWRGGLTYETPAIRFPNSKNLPENMKMARCISGNALPKGDSSHPANLRLKRPKADDSSEARKYAKAEGEFRRVGKIRKMMVAARRYSSVHGVEERGKSTTRTDLSRRYPPFASVIG